MADIITISNISEYVQSVCKLNDEVNEYPRLWNKEILFRGQSNKDYELLPGIARDCRFSTDCTIFLDERNMIDMAKYKLPDVFRDDQTPLELLALLQHYGIPTRLLDVTENALVALYFACCSNSDTDGEVIVFKHINEHITSYPIVNGIADSYRFADATWTLLEHFYNDIKNQPYSLEQKQTFDVCHSDDVKGGEWIKECCKKIFYIYAPVRSLRQQAQQGRYILFPNHIGEFLNQPAFEKTIDPIPKDHEDITTRFIIPKDIKNQLLMDLSILGINKDFLFCDSVDIVCDGIVDKFKTRYSKVRN